MKADNQRCEAYVQLYYIRGHLALKWYLKYVVYNYPQHVVSVLY